MNIREMKDGRGLDELIMTKVMGWKKESDHKPLPMWRDNNGFNVDHIARFFTPSVDISDAWEVFGKMDMPAYIVKSYLKTFGVGEIGWRVNWCKEVDCGPSDICKHGNDIWELTAPLAISKATLLQIKGEK